MKYAFAGLHVVSSSPIAGLREVATDSGAAQIAIERVPLPDRLQSVMASFPEGEWDGEQLLIRIRGVARYLIKRDRIGIDREPDAHPGDVDAFLLGTALGALWHLRGGFPLHAAAIHFDDYCVAFTGESGAGKSTMAAALAGRGHKVFSDDVSYIRSSGLNLEAYPGANRIRLWDSAMDGLNYNKQGVERELRGFDKFLIPFEGRQDAARPMRLAAIYRLETAFSDSQPYIDRLKGMAAFEAILQNTYRLQLAEAMGRRQQVFEFCKQIAGEVPVFQLSRPMNFEMLGKVLDLVENHLQCLVGR